MKAAKLTESTASALATALKESLDPADHSHNNLYSWLSDALADCKPAGCWCYLQDFIGDSESGEVFFCCSGDLTKAPYTITQDAGKISVKIDMTACEDVLAVTTYKVEDPASEPEPVMDYAGMEAGGLYAAGDETPLIERNITQKMRKSIPSDDFAGKNKSFPISKAEDVKAAVSSMGRAGSNNYDAATLKANIIRIAKKKGFTSELPKAWTDSKAEESTRAQEAGARHSKTDQQLIQNIHDHAIALGATAPTANDNNVEEAAMVEGKGYRLCESAHMSTDFQFKEAAALSPTVKIISPGRGSSGYYTKEVLERDGPTVFGRGTLMFINHATEAERASRPEGDWSQLAAVTEGPAQWQDSGPDGPGLYAPAAVFSKFAEEVREKAPFTGVSINAFGQFAEAATGEPNPDVKFSESKKAPDGKPGLIGKLTFAESIDLVTKAGRDGKLLLESASIQTQEQQEQSMAEDQKLTEALGEIKKLKERAAVTDAAGAVAEYFRSVRVPSQVIVERVTARVLAGTIPLTEGGDLDRKKVKEFVEAQLNEELAFLKSINPSLVTGMGTAPTQMSEAEIEKRQKREKEALLEASDRFAKVMGFGGDEHKIGRKILREGREGFDVHYNARTRGREVSSELGSLGLEA
jgi:hypothetical protein